MTTIPDLLGRIRPCRRIDAVTAVLLPFTAAGRPDEPEFRRHLKRTQAAGLVPAVNMDTGFGPQLTPAQRSAVLVLTRETLGPGARFVAGAQAFGVSGDPVRASRASVDEIVAAGGTPILFQHEALADLDGDALAGRYREIAGDAPEVLLFELGPQFASFGRIYDLDTIKRLMEIPAVKGLKHSSLDRLKELDRLAARDALRPEFRIYTGNDLAIDMVMYGSDYLLGLSTFDPEAFARRDSWWAEGDPRFYELNDALQALGDAAFREPVPAYKHSAAVYLKLKDMMADPHPHPDCPQRSAWEADLLRPLAARVAAAMEAAEPG